MESLYPERPRHLWEASPASHQRPLSGVHVPSVWVPFQHLAHRKGNSKCTPVTLVCTYWYRSDLLHGVGGAKDSIGTEDGPSLHPGGLFPACEAGFLSVFLLLRSSQGQDFSAQLTVAALMLEQGLSGWMDDSPVGVSEAYPVPLRAGPA